jgi:hypothetical protein
MHIERHDKVVAKHQALFVVGGFVFAFLLSKFHGFALGYGLDDFATLSAGSEELWRHLLAQGRFTFAGLHKLVTLAGLQQPDFATIGLGLTTVAFAWFLKSVFEQVQVQHPVLGAAIGVLLGSDPFFAEYVSFRQSLLPLAACMAITTCALLSYLRWRRNGRLRMAGLAVVLGAVAAGLNQLAVAFLCIGILACEMNNERTTGSLSRVAKATLWTAVTGALVTILYTVLAHLAAGSLGVTDAGNERFALVSASALGDRADQVARLLSDLAGGRHALHSGIMIACVWLAAGILALPFGDVRSRLLQGGIASAFFVLSVSLALLPAAAAGVWWPMPRVLIGLPFALGVALALLARGALPSQLVASAGLLFVSSLLLAGQSSSLLIDQQRLNRWDMDLARSVVSVIDSRFGRAEEVAIIIHNPRWAHSVAPNIAYGDLNVSALSVRWAVDALFEESTGRRLDVSIGSGNSKFCSESGPRFPALPALTEIGRTVHVCM